MFIFPGHLPACCRHLKAALDETLHQPTKLHHVRDLVAAMAPEVNSYAHLCAVLKEQTVVRLKFTPDFIDLLYTRHKIQLSVEQAEEIQRALDLTPLGMMPNPDVELSSVEGMRDWSLPQCIENTRQLAGFLQRLADIGAGPELQAFDIDTEFYFDDQDEVIDSYLLEMYWAQMGDNKEPWIDDPEHEMEFDKAFEAWVETSGLKPKLIAWCEWNNRESILREMIPKMKVTSFWCDDLANLPDGSAREAIFSAYGDRGVICVWQACKSSQDAFAAWDDSELASCNQATDRLAFAAVFSKGAWHPVGIASALSVSGQSPEQLLQVGDEHSAMGNDMAKATFDYIEEQEGIDVESFWNGEAFDALIDFGAVTVTALLESQLFMPATDPDVRAWLLSTMTKETDPLLFPAADDYLFLGSAELADQESLSFVFPSTVALIQTVGPEPVSRIVQPELVLSRATIPMADREPMTEEIETNMKETLDLAERVSRYCDISMRLATYDPRSYPLT